MSAKFDTPVVRADLLFSDEAGWIAFETVGDRGSSEVELVRLSAPSTPVARFPGCTPNLAWTSDGRVLLCHTDSVCDAPMICRVGDPDGNRWSPAVDVGVRAGVHVFTNGRLLRTASGTLFLPSVWHATHGASSAAPFDSGDSTQPVLGERDDMGQEIVLYASQTDGASWFEAGSFDVQDASGPMVSEIPGDSLVLIFQSGGGLWRRASGDGGHHWTPAESISLPSAMFSPTLRRSEPDEQLILVWVDPQRDGSWADPALRALRSAISDDGGRTWRGPCAFAVHPGWIPGAPALAVHDGRFGIVYGERRNESQQCAVVCRVDGVACVDAHCLPDVEFARARYSVDQRIARDALRTWSAHTMARPSRDPRLFVEAYFMRGFVAAYEALADYDDESPEWFDRGALLASAIEFADRMVRTQSPLGYWSLGYSRVYFADLGAAVALFAALDPHIDSSRRAGYLRAGEAFAAALQRDDAFLEDGAVATGWNSPIETLELAFERGLPPLPHKPYLVSTSLAGVELHSWLFRNLQKPEYRQRALAALQFTLTQLQPDGSLPHLGTGEGEMLIAAYVQEGWIAADVFLGDETVLEDLRSALTPHVRWLLRTQRDDGTWHTGADGEFARTSMILNFLIWYDQRCEANDTIDFAVRRGSRALLDPERWPWMYGAGEHRAVLRALAGRPMAAVAVERYFP